MTDRSLTLTKVDPLPGEMMAYTTNGGQTRIAMVPVVVPAPHRSPEWDELPRNQKIAAMEKLLAVSLFDQRITPGDHCWRMTGPDPTTERFPSHFDSLEDAINTLFHASALLEEFEGHIIYHPGPVSEDSADLPHDVERKG